MTSTTMADGFAEATAEAAQLLFQLRLRYSSEIPMPIWAMMAHAEAILNRELVGYLRSPLSAATVVGQPVSA